METKSFCKECGSKFQSYEQDWYDEYTGEKVFKSGCSREGCRKHCDVLGGCDYIKKWFFGIEVICKRCGHTWGNYM